MSDGLLSSNLMSIIMDLKATIEALLFFRGEPTSIKRLADITGESEEKVVEAIDNLSDSLKERGIVLLKKDGEVMLGTNPRLGLIIEKLVKEDLHKDLGKAGLETLSIILYLSPVPRSRVDYIRGVSSTFIIRNLLIRGLVERVENPDDRRGFLYRPTFELLSYLGIEKIEDLPEYQTAREELVAREKTAEEVSEDN